jgi:hypothetical protein
MAGRKANHTSTTKERTILTAEQDARAAHLRAEGRKYKDIAAELGCSVGTAYTAVTRAIAAVPVEAVGELRAVECARLDAVIARLWDIVHADHPYISQGRRFDDLQDSGPVISALSGIVKASESKRKLLGLDAPARQTITVVTEDAVDAEIRRLEAEMAAPTGTEGAESVALPRAETTTGR